MYEFFGFGKIALFGKKLCIAYRGTGEVGLRDGVCPPVAFGSEFSAVEVRDCADHEVSWHRKADGKDHADIDVAIAVEHLCLAAAEQGLGTCWVCNFDVDRCREVMHLPANLEPVVLIPLGYPADETVPEKKRKTLPEILL